MAYDGFTYFKPEIQSLTRDANELEAIKEGNEEVLGQLTEEENNKWVCSLPNKIVYSLYLLFSLLNSYKMSKNKQDEEHMSEEESYDN